MGIEIEDQEQRQVVAFRGFAKAVTAIIVALVVASLTGIIGALWYMSMQMAEDRGTTMSNFNSITVQLGLIRSDLTHANANNFTRIEGEELKNRVDRLESYHRK